MNNQTKKPSLTSFAIGLPDNQTTIEGHINPQKLPIGYLMAITTMINKKSVNTVVNLMKQN